MKIALILVLLLALAAGAYLSRPTADDFKQFIVAQKTRGEKGLIQKGIDQFKAESYADSCTFCNRIFWTGVQHNGQTVYTGAFSHWFSRADVDKDIDTFKTDVKTVKQQVEGLAAQKAG